MAARQFDELTTIRKKLTKAEARKKIREYFDEMDIPENDKAERTKTAYGLFAIFTAIFALISADMEIYGIITEEAKIGYCEKAEADFRSVLEDNGYSEYLNELWDKISETVRQIVDDTINNTSEYYTSDDRAVTISETETNKAGNLKAERKAVKAGYVNKTWITKRDNKVRHTHTVLDGVTIGIFDTFNVGGYEMHFPCDESLGAGPEEIVNCRCTLKYTK